MKKINFELVFKIIVLIQLTILLIINVYNVNSNGHSENQSTINEPSEIGRYKEIKIKSELGEEHILILDTKTGETTRP